MRARVVLSLALLIGAKVTGLAAPFLFKEICDALDASQLVLASTSLPDGAAAAVSATKVALAVPLAALLGCACGGRFGVQPRTCIAL